MENAEKLQNLQRELGELKSKQYSLRVSAKEAEEALELHLEQLHRLGATLEDSICIILRKVIENAELQKEIDEKEELIRIYK